jgi:hypothetical protein
VTTRTLEQQLAAAELKANRLRHQLSETRRKEETRRKIVVGGTILAAMQSDPDLHGRIVAALRRLVTRDIDKAAVADLLADGSADPLAAADQQAAE